MADDLRAYVERDPGGGWTWCVQQVGEASESRAMGYSPWRWLARLQLRRHLRACREYGDEET